VIDPEREYQQVAKSVGGTYIKLSSTSKEKINPFDLKLKTYNGNNSLAEHIQDLTEVISLMAGSLSDEERAVVDKALIETYKKKGITLRKKKYLEKQKFPLLKDFYKTLQKMKQPDLCHRLDRFVTGSLSNVFNQQTNVDLSNRLVVFDLKDLDESLRQMMVLTIANHVQSQVKSDPQKRVIVIDEGWLLLQHEESARFLAGLVRRARKHYLGVTLISQQANDFLHSEYGRAIASQSSLRILMKQDTTTINKVVTEFNLSEYEKQFLLTCDRGEALIIADQNHVAVKVVASDKEHPMLTTDPREVYKA
jgi:type IV secretory pathway VirB4 component